jgi:murein L,D-transpeptidase YafK
VSGIAALSALLVVLFFSGSFDQASAAPGFSDGGAERVQRRQAAREGRLSLPLPGTPDTQTPLTRLQAAGVSLGARMMIRIFKAESELELWFEKDGTYIHFATYPVCFWSGTLGPKLREGDRQAPEGFYTITSDQLHFGDRWRRSLDIGFPNVFDRVNGRTGSLILVHGGCDSVGCFAMTNPVNAELYDLVSATLRSSTHYVPVHVFPFRMSDENIALNANALWKDFWSDLKQGYDSFERTRLPPSISVCNKRYLVRDTLPGRVQDAGIELCPEDAVALGAQSTDKGAGPNKDVAEPKTNTGKGASISHVCSTARASCRRWVALRERKLAGDFTPKKNASRQQQVSKIR